MPLKYNTISKDSLNIECEENEPLLSPKNCQKLVNVEILVSTIRCAGCVHKLEEIIEAIPGVIKCEVNIVTKIASVTFDSEHTSTENIIDQIIEKKHKAVLMNFKGVTRVYFKFMGEINKLEEFMAENIIKTRFVKKLNHQYSIIELEYIKNLIGIRTIVKKFYDIGGANLIIMDKSDVFPSETQSDTKLWQKLFFTAAFFGIFTMILMVYDMTIPEKACIIIMPGLSLVNLLLLICTTVVQIMVGRFLYKSAYASLFTGINMDFLISTATTIAYLYSCIILLVYIFQKRPNSPHTFFETSGMLYMIVSLGRWIESYGKATTIESIRRLMKSEIQRVDIMLENDDRKTFSKNEEINSNLIQKNDYILIYKGMKIPADGVIEQCELSAEINESILTGESTPVFKEKSAEVFSGCINEGLPFIMKVKKTGEECRIQIISQCVEQAMSKKLPMTNVVNVISKYFTPTILILAIITLTCWSLVFYFEPKLLTILKISSATQFSFQTAISVICVACPCALGLAIPLAVMVATGVGAKHGIYIKGGPPIQLLSSIDMFVFDKTGTITKGKPIVSLFTVIDKEKELKIDKRFLKALYSIVSKSNHVLSTAIKNYLFMILKQNDVFVVSNFSELSGKGIIGEIEFNEKDSISSIKVIVGSDSFLKSKDISFGDESKITADLKTMHSSSVVFAALDNQLYGYFIINDEIRKDAMATIAYLKSANIETVILSGDRHETTQYVADKIGVTNWFYGQLPEQKSEYINNIINSGKKVAMVGDGFNDIIAISRATIGIAIGSGTDIAAETANVVLMSDKLFDIINLLEISRITMRAIRRNLILSSVYNILAVPIAAGCFKWAGVDIQPWIASIAMVISSLSVTASSLVIKLFKPTTNEFSSNQAN